MSKVVLSAKLLEKGKELLGLSPCLLLGVITEGQESQACGPSDAKVAVESRLLALSLAIPSAKPKKATAGAHAKPLYLDSVT